MTRPAKSPRASTIPATVAAAGCGVAFPVACGAGPLRAGAPGDATTAGPDDAAAATAAGPEGAEVGVALARAWWLSARDRLTPALAGRLINELRDLAIVMKDLPEVTVSPDPWDTYLLATAAAGGADFLVTGDKRDLLPLGRYAGAKIVTVRDFLVLNRRLP